ncbi:MAG: DUF1957 domain-containing protein [Deltaproteobacteria bacterium]|nr:DUF1957 domain-containing protein [Deltaproteobacteria bacterium]
MSSPQGYLALVLHAHLPFVRHPEHERFLEEDWLYEAITECYLPLLDMMDRLSRKSVPFHFSLVLTPTLLSMLGDDLLRSRYLKHLGHSLELAYRERMRTSTDPRFSRLAQMYVARLQRAKRMFTEVFEGDLVQAFGGWEKRGHIELLTCAATHAYLPLLSVQPQVIAAQLKTAVTNHQQAFGRRPKGIWLPECGYCPPLQSLLTEQGLEYTFLDAHGLLQSEPRPSRGVFAPVAGNKGLIFFGRDLSSSRQVWSATEGYPGHPAYREFYRDIGFDLDLDYIRPYIQPTGARKNTGIKYHRITGATQDKEPYLPELAVQQAELHAKHFLKARLKQARKLHPMMGDRPALVLAPFDAELFGHWWYEGPIFLEKLFTLAAREPELETITPSEYLTRHSDLQSSEPQLSSWGQGGYNAMWLNESNDWVYRHLHWAGEHMIQLAEANPQAKGLRRRALNQAARELMLAQASDWAFIMKTGTAVEYAVRRTREHLEAFAELHKQLSDENAEIDQEFLINLERRHNLFPQIDYKSYLT